MFAIKVKAMDRHATTVAFANQKTMYGGKLVAAGNPLFVFSGENRGASQLVALGTVVSVSAVPKTPGVERQTPRVDIVVRLDHAARKRLGRDELVSYSSWHDGQPETELNFKLFRQSTAKIVGITPGADRFLRGCF